MGDLSNEEVGRQLTVDFHKYGSVTVSVDGRMVVSGGPEVFEEYHLLVEEVRRLRVCKSIINDFIGIAGLHSGKPIGECFATVHYTIRKNKANMKVFLDGLTAGLGGVAEQLEIPLPNHSYMVQDSASPPSGLKMDELTLWKFAHDLGDRMALGFEYVSK